MCKVINISFSSTSTISCSNFAVNQLVANGRKLGFQRFCYQQLRTRAILAKFLMVLENFQEGGIYNSGNILRKIFRKIKRGPL